MSFSQYLQRIPGLLNQAPIGPPGVVGVLPDDYLPPLLEETVGGISLAAGGAGVRSEICLLTFATFPDQFGFEISNLRVTALTAGASLEIVIRSAISGGTTTAMMASDCGNRNTRLFQNTINTAAAGTTTRTIVPVITVVTANEYVTVPGRFIVRGGVGNNHICIRPVTDNVGLRIMFAARFLEKRSL